MKHQGHKDMMRGRQRENEREGESERTKKHFFLPFFFFTCFVFLMVKAMQNGPTELSAVA